MTTLQRSGFVPLRREEAQPLPNELNVREFETVPSMNLKIWFLSELGILLRGLVT